MHSSTDAKVIDLTIRIGFLGLFIYGSLMLVAPLVGLMLWAVILTVAVYPLHATLSGWLGGRQKISATFLTLIGLAITLGPVALLGLGIMEAGQTINEGLAKGTLHIPPPSETVIDWPVVGPKLHAAWNSAHSDILEMIGRFEPQLLKAGSLLLGQLAGASMGVLTLAMAVLIMGVLLIAGPGLVMGARKFANRVFADSGPLLVDMAGATVRNVSRGVIGVAVIQALMAGIVMAAFGIGAAGPLSLVALLLGVIQIGPGPVLLPVIIWAWTSMDTVTALLFTLLMLPVMVIDNVLKPIFMSRGLNTPMLVILIGVLGGLMAYGLIGIFVGPVILSVFYELFTHWINHEPEPAAARIEEET
ncbi:AI-2E family transporter [Aliiruegeria sabulilitoris]|uniref:AI-2E family transporter n=1 Tax=Aliiruegeria sabulilitoris TaxID=1510458 RepID=UPI00082B2646|nr:AI-2E family transporter [Aliiruegeria sabulilitoris]NDR56497.1 AI-2E family transporter [Pseudoruegeria sp. M32A2M]